jgi:hypothetical protein
MTVLVGGMLASPTMVADSAASAKRGSDGGSSMKRLAMAVALALSAACSARPAAAAAASDYPTDVLADYVFGCMASNGQTQEVLRRCSCSIDVIASIIPYDKYVEASTILSMQQVPGENTAIFRDVPWTQESVANLRRAQVEAELRCF